MHLHPSGHRDIEPRQNLSLIFRTRSDFPFMKIENSLLSEEQAAEYLNLSVSTLRRRRASGQVGYIRDGRISYRLSDLDAYIEALRVAATQPPPAPRPPKYRSATKAFEANRAALAEFI